MKMRTWKGVKVEVNSELNSNPQPRCRQEGDTLLGPSIMFSPGGAYASMKQAMNCKRAMHFLLIGIRGNREHRNENAIASTQ